MINTALIEHYGRVDDFRSVTLVVVWLDDIVLASNAVKYIFDSRTRLTNLFGFYTQSSHLNDGTFMLWTEFRRYNHIESFTHSFNLIQIPQSTINSECYAGVASVLIERTPNWSFFTICIYSKSHKQSSVSLSRRLKSASHTFGFYNETNYNLLIEIRDHFLDDGIGFFVWSDSIIHTSNTVKCNCFSPITCIRWTFWSIHIIRWHFLTKFSGNKNVFHRQNGRKISKKNTHTTNILSLYQNSPDRLPFAFQNAFFPNSDKYPLFCFNTLRKINFRINIVNLSHHLDKRTFSVSTSFRFWQRVAKRASRMIL